MSDRLSPEEAISYRGPDEVVRGSERLKELQNQPILSNFKSGYGRFDKKLGGLNVGDLVVITGHRKNGKSLFVESWVRGIMSQDPLAQAVIFSWENDQRILLEKYVGDGTHDIYVPKMLETANYNWFKDRIIEAKFKYNCRIVVIDHLHFMVDMDTKQNMSLNIGAFVRRLKHEIANELKMSVLLVAHQGQPKGDASMDSMRDSSFIGQESDSVIVVSRKKNMKETEIQEYESRSGKQYCRKSLYSGNLDEDDEDDDIKDEYSDGLCIVEIGCSRRTGVYQWKKLFQKRGDFLEEL